MALPYNDDDMKYDISRQQYILTKDCLLNNLFLDESIERDLQTSTKVNQFLIEVSDDIYRFIYTQTLLSQIPIKRYLLAKREDFRNVIKRAMLAQARYGLRSGGMAIKDQHGMDFERIKFFELQDLRGQVRLAPQAVEFLSEAGLLYSGRIHVRIDDLNDGTY